MFYTFFSTTAKTFRHVSCLYAFMLTVLYVLNVTEVGCSCLSLYTHTLNQKEILTALLTNGYSFFFFYLCFVIFLPFVFYFVCSVSTSQTVKFKLSLFKYNEKESEFCRDLLLQYSFYI